MIWWASVTGNTLGIPPEVGQNLNNMMRGSFVMLIEMGCWEMVMAVYLIELYRPLTFEILNHV